MGETVVRRQCRQGGSGGQASPVRGALATLLGVLLALAACVVALGFAVPQRAIADDTTIVAQGTSGGCAWTLDAEGLLVIAPADGVSGQLESTSIDNKRPGTISATPSRPSS